MLVFKKIIILLSEYKEFRNLFIYRNRYAKPHRLFCKWVALWYPPEKTLYIDALIGLHTCFLYMNKFRNSLYSDNKIIIFLNTSILILST